MNAQSLKTLLEQHGFQHVEVQWQELPTPDELFDLPLDQIPHIFTTIYLARGGALHVANVSIYLEGKRVLMTSSVALEEKPQDDLLALLDVLLLRANDVSVECEEVAHTV